MTGPCKSRPITIVLDDARWRQQNNCIFWRENLVGRESGLVGEIVGARWVGRKGEGTHGNNVQRAHPLPCAVSIARGGAAVGGV